MSTDSSQPPMNPVCDLCYSRKVRCDRCDPCGNCQDAAVTCSRSRHTSRRTRKKATRAPRQVSTRNAPARDLTVAADTPDEMAQADVIVDDMENVLAKAPATEMSRVSCQAPPFAPKSQSHVTASPLPLFDAQIAIQHNLAYLQGLATCKRRILESALHVASHLPEYFGGAEHAQWVDPIPSSQDSSISVELLTWMLKDIKAARFGPFARDYFKHIPEATLREMGLSLLSKKTSSTDLILATVCVNAVCFKFLTTVLSSEDDDSGITSGLSHTALQCRSTAQAAIQRIPLLAPPSLALLQAILSGIFLYQGSGEVTMCWDLTRAACRICSDLGLDEFIRQRRTMSEPEYYCFIWCYMLDKNYSFKLGRFKALLDVELGFNIHDMPTHHHGMSEYLSINVDLARIQAALIPFFGKHPAPNSQDSMPNFDNLGEHLMMQMQRIQARIDKIANPSMLWEGLDAQSEISVLEFASHSTVTMIFHLFQRSMVPSLDSRCLQSARQSLSALVSMCLTSTKQSAAAFLHWTLLFYPITAYFVLFCNVVATSDAGDFNLMRTIADCLGRSEMKSRPIAQVRTVFLHFVSLTENFTGDESRAVAQPPEVPMPTESHAAHSMDEGFPFHAPETEQALQNFFGLDIEGDSAITSLPLTEMLQFNGPFALSDVDDL